MTKLRQYFGYIISALTVLVSFLLFLISRKNREIDDLHADADLADQKAKSEEVDKKVDSAQAEIDTLSQEMKKPVSDEFWDEYLKGKKK